MSNLTVGNEGSSISPTNDRMMAVPPVLPKYDITVGKIRGGHQEKIGDRALKICTFISEHIKSLSLLQFKTPVERPGFTIKRLIGHGEHFTRKGVSDQ